MIPDTLLDQLFQLPDVYTGEDLRSFLKENGPGVPASVSVFDRLFKVAARAGNRLQASAAGHQASVRRLFPGTPDDAVTAFCISEEKGPRPAFIFTRPHASGRRLCAHRKEEMGKHVPFGRRSVCRSFDR